MGQDKREGWQGLRRDLLPAGPDFIKLRASDVRGGKLLLILWNSSNSPALWPVPVTRQTQSQIPPFFNDYNSQRLLFWVPDTLLSTFHLYLPSQSSQPSVGDIPLIPILQMKRKQRRRVMKWKAQAHTAVKRQSWDLNSRGCSSLNHYSVCLLLHIATLIGVFYNSCFHSTLREGSVCGENTLVRAGDGRWAT